MTRTIGNLRPTLVVAALITAVAAPAVPAAASAATVPTTRAQATAAPAAASATLVPFGSSWRYSRETTAPRSTAWKRNTTDWATGRAPFGAGSATGTLATKLPDSMTPKPLATYFQRSFRLDTIPAGGVQLTTWADDGVVVYVNGTEVLRSNVSGAPKHEGWWAQSAPTSSKARAKLVTATIPASALNEGHNIVAAQVQSNYRSTPNLTFDAQLVSTGAAAAPPSQPAPPQPAPPRPAPPQPAPPAPTPPVGGPEILPSPGNAAKWGEPTWRDEFTYIDPKTGKPAVDPTKWNVRDSSEMGLFMDAAKVDSGQVSVDDKGIAHLRADWLGSPISRPHPTWPDVVTHKTGYMDQRTLNAGDVSRTQRWGRWEMRAQVPVGPKTYGALAAFWLRNSKSGEIDIMEAWGYNEKAAPGGQRIGSSTTTVHNDTMNIEPDRLIRHHVDGGGPSEVHKEFHVWAFELMPTYAAVYVDDVRVMYETPQSYPDLWNEAYFGSPFHMRLNLHVGPSAQYWGLPDPAHKDWTQNLDYKVDYVRTWSVAG
ncbi:glycosyl hydrolase family 16 [Diaminobutyricimonas aerilata]|uniref:Glycosyl hydrolase family 16 n=1 Tax=Diaminobutyricimonas aerilata TaxID=1162967 RepID=A0A2M9CK30_9MICO|nr:family 16 glycosylhydrolase [Diaminobutyricimonas aerilata]PJJ72249.1 glycosyl hydrolase family 16 [Diaminobutyricimonas aerilata]